MARLKGQINAAAHVPNPDRSPYDRVIIHGLSRIGDYMGCTARTIQTWRRRYDFPISKLPNGGYATSTELIDRWLLSRNPNIAPFLS